MPLSVVSLGLRAEAASADDGDNELDQLPGHHDGEAVEEAQVAA